MIKVLCLLYVIDTDSFYCNCNTNIAVERVKRTNKLINLLKKGVVSRICKKGVEFTYIPLNVMRGLYRCR